MLSNNFVYLTQLLSLDLLKCQYLCTAVFQWWVWRCARAYRAKLTSGVGVGLYPPSVKLLECLPLREQVIGGSHPLYHCCCQEVGTPQNLVKQLLCSHNINSIVLRSITALWPLSSWMLLSSTLPVASLLCRSWCMPLLWGESSPIPQLLSASVGRCNLVVFCAFLFPFSCFFVNMHYLCCVIFNVCWCKCTTLFLIRTINVLKSVIIFSYRTFIGYKLEQWLW